MNRLKSSLYVGALAVFAGVSLPCSLLAQTSAKASAPAARLDHRELPADQQIIHALNRLAYGPRPGDVQKVRAIGLDKWIDQQLHPEKIDDSSLDEFMKHYSTLN